MGVEAKQGGDLCEHWLGIKVHGMRHIYEMREAINEATVVISTKKFGGLQGLTVKHLGMWVDLKKDVRGQTSHWHLDQPLTDMQVDYAANDALLHVLIYGKLYAEMQAHALVVEPLAGQDLASTETIPPTFSSEYIPIPAKVVVPQPDTKDQVKAKWTASQWELHSKLTARRDEILVKLGRNPKKEAHTVAHNNDSYVLVRDQPTTIDALENRSGMNQPLKTIFMYAFLNIV